MGRGRGGRPAKILTELGTIVPIGTRVSAEIRIALQRAAIESGRSLSQEIERRLANSFRDDEILRRLERIEALLAPSTADPFMQRAS